MERNSAPWLLAAFAAPAIAVACALPWPYVAVCTLVGAGLWYLPRPATPLAVVTLRVWGKGAGGVLVFLQAVFAVALLSQFAMGTDSAFPDVPAWPFLPLSMLAVAWFAVSRGEAACLRAGRVSGAVMTVTAAAVCFFALRRADWSRLWMAQDAPRWMDYLLMLLVPLYGRHLIGSGPIRWWGLAALLPVTASLLCRCIAGSGGTFYSMAQSVEVLSFAQRIEPLVSAAMTVGWFCALCLISFSAVRLFRAMGLSHQAGEFCTFLPAAACVLAKVRIPAMILFPLGTVFCVLLPLLTQGIGGRKKVKNFLKFQQKKC